MHRVPLALTLVLAASTITSCSNFKNQRTPGGDFCSDMPVIPAGQEADREYHRLQPISSDPKARTEAERLESLRKAACAVGGDAVIEAVNEEVRAENATYTTVSSGTAVIWLRRPQGEVKPLTLHNAPKPSASGSPSAGASGTPNSGEPDTTPPPAATDEPTAKPSATPSAPPAKTSTPTAPPAKTAKPVAPPPKKK